MEKKSHRISLTLDTISTNLIYGIQSLQKICLKSTLRYNCLKFSNFMETVNHKTERLSAAF